MDIETELKQSQSKYQEIISRIQTLEQQKQQLMQEALRLDGEVRVLLRLNKDDVRGE